MKNKSTWLCLGLLWLSLTGIAQNNQKFKRLTSETGLHLQTTLDQRFTANAVRYTGFQTRTGFEFGTAQKFNRIELSFAKNFRKRQGLSSYINLNPAISYTHLRATSKTNLLLGGKLDYGNLLIFPEADPFENNPIAYTFWVSLGVTTRWQRTFRWKQQKVKVSLDGNLPLVGYVIRPAFAHPYPTNYLEAGVFDFERTGMGKYLVTSGQIKSLNQFVNPKIKTTLGFPFGNRGHAIGLTYNWEFLWVGGEKKLWQAQQQLSLNLFINL